MSFTAGWEQKEGNMGKRKVLLIFSALVAVMATALPSSASAEGFTHEGKPLEGSHESELSGFVGFGTGVGTFGCSVTKKETKTRFVSHITDIEYDTSDCEGTGAMAGCELVEDEVTDLPITVYPVVGTFFNFDTEFHMTFINCPLSEVDFTYEEMILTPDDPEEIETLEVSGEGVWDTLGQELEAFAFGELDVVGADAGTYGIE